MKVVIIEDEGRAANRIAQLLAKLRPEYNLLCVLESVAEAIPFLNENKVQLIISDIQLADGLSFEIYKQSPPQCPIIFTTAYQQYAIEAFETNGIDYLVKPIEEDRFERALLKLEQLQSIVTIDQILALATVHRKKNYKSRFVVKVGDKIKTIPVSEVLLFFSANGGTYVRTKQNRNYLLDQSLEQIHLLLDPQTFFRISRKFIVSIETASTIVAHSNSRLKLKIHAFDEEEVVVAREKVKEFKAWLDQ